MEHSPALPPNVVRSSVLLAVILAALALAAGCGDDGGGGSGGSSGTGGSGGEDDGKVHPEPNGVAIAEEAACQTVLSAFQDRITALGCTGTAPSCPGLIQAPSGAPACSQYDEGTAQGCADHVTAGSDCEDTRARLDVCIVEPIADSEPAGCP